MVIGEEEERGRTTGATVADDLEVDVGRRTGAEGLALLGADLAQRIQVKLFFRHPVKGTVGCKIKE